MLTLLSALGSLLSLRVRSRAAMEFELVALRHQLTVLRRQRCAIATSVARPELFCDERTCKAAAVPGVSPVSYCATQTGALRTHAERSRCKRAALYSITKFLRPQTSSTGFLAGWTFEQTEVCLRRLH
jgi:hypothetical protein